MVIKFDDIDNRPTDLLSDDYTSKVTLKCKKNAGPLAVTIETDYGSGGALTSKVGTKFTYAGLSFDKIQLKPDGSHALETSIKPCPPVVLSFKGAKGADLGLDYTHGSFRATGTLDVKEMSKFTTSACLGVAAHCTVGGNATYAMSGKTGVSAFNVGASYANGPLFLSVTTASKLSRVNLGLLYDVNSHLSLASTSTHSSSKPLDVITVGGKYKAEFADVKAKFGSDGVISACVIKEVAPKVTLTASGSAPASDFSKFKYGIGIVM